MIIVYTYVAKFQHDEDMDKPQAMILLFILPPMISMMADDQMEGVKKQNHVMNCSWN